MNNPLPKDLISINNACIDYAYGRTDSVPKDIKKLFNWHHEKYLLNEMISVVCAIDLKEVKKYAFEDIYIIDMEDCEPEEITDKTRISFAKSYLEREMEDSASDKVLQFDTFFLAISADIKTFPVTNFGILLIFIFCLNSKLLFSVSVCFKAKVFSKELNSNSILYQFLILIIFGS